jgi:hypothetical protein
MGTYVNLPDEIANQLADYAEIEEISFDEAYVRILSEGLSGLPVSLPERNVWERIHARPALAHPPLDPQQLNTQPAEEPDDEFLCTFLPKYFEHDQQVRFTAERKSVAMNTIVDGLRRLCLIANTDRNWFTITHPGGTVGGIGIKHFVTSLEAFEERFGTEELKAGLDTHTYVYASFLSRLSDGQDMHLCLEINARFGNITQCTLEFLTSGYPVDTRRYRALAAQFGFRSIGNARATDLKEVTLAPDEPLKLSVKERHHRTESSPEYPYVVGLVIENPFKEDDELYQKLLSKTTNPNISSVNYESPYRQLREYDNVYANLRGSDVAQGPREYYLDEITIQRLSSAFGKHTVWNVGVRADY